MNDPFNSYSVFNSAINYDHHVNYNISMSSQDTNDLFSMWANDDLDTDQINNLYDINNDNNKIMELKEKKKE